MVKNNHPNMIIWDITIVLICIFTNEDKTRKIKDTANPFSLNINLTDKEITPKPQ